MAAPEETPHPLESLSGVADHPTTPAEDETQTRQFESQS